MTDATTIAAPALEGAPAKPDSLLPDAASAARGDQQLGRLPELLSPAGDWECARAAVENGADAIYFGLTRFNARLRARNFTETDLPDLMAWLHGRGVRGYVTVNTLVFTEELAEAEAYLRAIIAAGVDAVIVQDVGLCRLIREISPDFPIHASTQMTITSAAGVAFARELGCQVIVMARENTVQELQSIQQTTAAGTDPVPLEVFVHGALCVAYSGQCLTSEALGGRSANRGECAQACRLPYELVADGRKVDLGDRRYLLSPQDLAGLNLLPDLVRAGVASLKIEGRLKSPEYVASITRVYRAALDQLGARPAASCGSGDAGNSELKDATSPSTKGSRPPHYELEMAFSRGLHTGWLGGIDNQALVHGRFGKKRGVFLGLVSRVTHDRVWIRLEGPVKAGDGVVFDDGRPDQPEEGGRIFRLESPAVIGSEVALSFMKDAVNLRGIRAGQRVWKTSDPELDRELRQTFEGHAPRRTDPIEAEVHGHAGAPLTLILRDQQGHTAQAESGIPLQEAHRQPLDDERLRDQLGRLGGTPYRLGGLRNRLEGPVMVPLGELNRVRRAAVAQLDARRAQPRRWQILPTPSRPPWGPSRLRPPRHRGRLQRQAPVQE